MKRKRQTLKPGQIAIDGQMLGALESMLTATDVIVRAHEDVLVSFVELLDQVLAANPDPTALSFRDVLARRLEHHRAARQEIDRDSALIRTLVAVSRSTLTQGSARVM